MAFLMNKAGRRIPSYIILFSRSIIHRSTVTAPLPSSSINAQKPQSKDSNEHENLKSTRATSTSLSTDKVVKTNKEVRTSNSFVMNLYRGQFYAPEVFPYPNVLNEEQKDNVKMLIDPICKFFEEKNDPIKNDQLGEVFIN